MLSFLSGHMIPSLVTAFFQLPYSAGKWTLQPKLLPKAQGKMVFRNSQQARVASDAGGLCQPWANSRICKVWLSGVWVDDNVLQHSTKPTAQNSRGFTSMTNHSAKPQR